MRERESVYTTTCTTAESAVRTGTLSFLSFLVLTRHFSPLFAAFSFAESYLHTKGGRPYPIYHRLTQSCRKELSSGLEVGKAWVARSRVNPPSASCLVCQTSSSPSSARVCECGHLLGWSFSFVSPSTNLVFAAVTAAQGGGGG